MDSTCEDIPGQFIHPINPPVAVRSAGVPTFLFESSILLTKASTIHQQLTPKDLQALPTVRRIRRSEHFPYRHQGKYSLCLLYMIFDPSSQERLVSFAKVKLERILRTGADPGSKTDLDLGNGQHLLAHMAAHILFDASIDPSHEPCGLCLRPSTCKFYLKRRREATYVDMKRSTCINLVRFKYALAESSTMQSPCSNVPRECPLCQQQGGKGQIAVYMQGHLQSRHGISTPDQVAQVAREFSLILNISELETQGLKAVWNSRLKKRTKRKCGPPEQAPLATSNAHSTRMALR